MKVYIQNDEPVWVRYSLSVEIDADPSMTDDEIKELALQKCHEGEYEVEAGPDVEAEVAGLDQEFHVEEIER